MIYASLARALSDNSKFDTQKDTQRETQRDSPGLLSHGDSGISGPESTRNILSMREAAESRSNMMCRNSEIGDRDSSAFSKEVSICVINGLLNFGFLRRMSAVTSDPRTLNLLIWRIWESNSQM
jgi:hypothetical protein